MTRIPTRTPTGLTPTPRPTEYRVTRDDAFRQKLNKATQQLRTLLERSGLFVPTILHNLRSGLQGTEDFYLLKARLAMTDFSYVDIAESKLTREKVIIKQVYKEAYLPRFRREQEILAQLKGRPVTEVLDHGSAGENEFFVMPYEVSVGLDRFIKEANGKITQELALAIFYHLLEAYEQVWVAGVVHRDAKPGNILLMANGPSLVKLIDFNVAKSKVLDKGLTAHGTVVGTLGYIAPESAKGSNCVDCRADLFALGVILAEMLNLRPEKSFAETRDFVIWANADVPVFDEEQLRSLPKPLALLIRRCTENNPDLRPEISWVKQQVATLILRQPISVW